MKKGMLLSFLGLAFIFQCINALNDMPLIAQFQGEHNNSGYGDTMVSLDFNHDGYDDLIVYSAYYGYQYQQTPSRGKVYVYYGGPSFSSTTVPTMTLEGDYPEGMQRKIGLIANVGDVNGDGFDDLMIGDAIPNLSSSARYMYYFGQTDDLSTPGYVQTPLPNETINRIDKLGDVDGDGYDDLGIAYTIDYELFFDIQWGGSYERQMIVSGVGRFNDTKAIIGIGDINNDGLEDFSIGYLDDEHGDYFSTVRLYYGTSIRVFSEFTILVHTSNAITRICKPLGDINGDGFDDVLGYIDDSGTKIWFGTDTNPTDNPNVILNPVYFGNASVRGVNSGDINADGFSDVVCASYDLQRFAIWLGNSTMNGQADWQKTSTYENFGYDLAVGDYNGDGLCDIAVSAPFEDGSWPLHDYRGYVFIYAGNTQMVGNDDPITPHAINPLSVRISPNPIYKDELARFEISGVNVKHNQKVSIKIYNLRGQLISQVDEISAASGTLTININMNEYSSGVYLCKVNIGSNQSIKKFSIIK